MRNLFRRAGSRPQVPLPHLIIAQRVIDKIISNALIYATETGESLVGLVVHPPENQETDLYVLDTISPDESAVRSGVYFEQGDDLQADIFNWLYDGWELQRKAPLEARWNVPLVHLGDWHKHPGTLVTPSMGDESTAREQISERSTGTPHLLVVLATVWEQYEALQEEKLDLNDLAELSDMIEVPGMSNFVVQPELEEESDPGTDIEDDLGTPLKYPIDDRTVVRIDCWYMSRQMRRFARLSPTVTPDRDLPGLPRVGWHLLHPERMRDEVERLSREGYSVSVEQFDIDQQAPLEICFSLARRDSQNVLILVTRADYPETMPLVRLTPMSAMRSIPERANLFKQLWEQSRPLPEADYPTWAWTPEHTLRDLVLSIEARLTEGNKR